MNGHLKKTRNCIEPWRTVQFDATGNISPCCSGTMKGNFGNINTDYFDAVQKGGFIGLFLNEDYRRLRNGLLTGELPAPCISCRSVYEEDITTEELQKKVIDHLESQGINAVGAELATVYAFSEGGGNITNRCNFSCVYCAHSGEGGHAGYYRAEMDRDHFLEFIDFLCSRGLKIFNFCGIGELTAYPEWQRVCGIIMQRHPQLRLRLISNFGREFKDSELDMLSRFDLVHVSCDTLDEQTYSWLRKGGRLPILLDNIRRLRERFSGDPGKDPKLAFNVTVTDMVVDKLEGLFRFAAANNMFVHLSALFVMPGSISSKKGCVKKISDMPVSQTLHVREVFYDLPRRMKAENPLSGVWEYKFLYKSIMQKADAISYDRFVPQTDELIYQLFHKLSQKDKSAYLRKFWLSFDEEVKGIFISAGTGIEIRLPFVSGEIVYRAVWCRDRGDGNLDILFGPLEEAAATLELTVAAENCGARYDHMLFEVVSYGQSANELKTVRYLSPVLPDGEGAYYMVREAFLMEDEEAVAQKLVDSQDPIVIWCAGLRALQLLSGTCMGKANIKMIIDGDPSKKGQLFCGRIIHSPEEFGDFGGKIVVLHASCPEQVELNIRRLGINNEIVIL